MSSNKKLSPEEEEKSYKTLDSKLWSKVRGWFNYPPLSDPKIKPNAEGGAYIDLKTTNIYIGQEFVDNVVNVGKISEEESLEGLVTHEVGHYMVFPRDFGVWILSGKMIDDFFGKEPRENKGYILQTYADMCNDVASVLDGNKRDAILKMRTASQNCMPDELNADIRSVMLKYLNHQADTDYKIKPELQQYVDRMLQIDFLDVNAEKLRLSLFQFGQIILDMLKQHKQKQQGGQGQGQGGQLKLGELDPKDMNLEEMLKNISDKDLRKAMREISGKISRGEYKKVKDWLKEKGVDTEESTTTIKNIGTSRGELKIDPEVVDYYKELSKNYPLIIYKKPMTTKKKVRTIESTKKWRVGSNPLLAMPNLSGGLYLPGITRERQIKTRPYITTDYDVPHLLVVIDSSGSMPDPKSTKSYAILAAFCAARSYHIHQSLIGVINFSGESFYLPYTRNLDEALAAISAFQGGGTTVDIDIVKKMLGTEMAELYSKHEDKDLRNLPKEALKKDLEISLTSIEKALEPVSLDMIMFTDGGISNLNQVIDLFAEKKQLNRATIVLTDHYDQNLLASKDKVNVYQIEDEQDIPKIVLKDIESNLSIAEQKKKDN